MGRPGLGGSQELWPSALKVLVTSWLDPSIGWAGVQSLFFCHLPADHSSLSPSATKNLLSVVTLLGDVWCFCRWWQVEPWDWPRSLSTNLIAGSKSSQDLMPGLSLEQWP